MKTTKLFLSIVIVFLLMITVWMSGCTEEKTDDSNDSGDAGNGDTTTSGLISAKDAWDKVKSAVETWDSNYRIARVRHYGTNQWDQQAKEISWDFYVESGDGSKSTTFTYSVEDGASYLTDTPIGTGRNTFLPVNWTVDSTEAAEIALNAIRENEFPDFDAGFEAVLNADENSNPYWVIDYSSRKKDGNYDLSIPWEYGDVQINAKTGEMISISGYSQ